MQVLPSGGQQPSSLALAPFRGLRYAPDRVSGLAEVTSPPYDVIAHRTADDLRADPHTVVRLILPHLAGAGAAGNGTGDGYASAARLLRDWQDTGILVPDPDPALYAYEQSGLDGTVLQRGLIGALGLAPLDAGPVLPHEDVFPGPVAGRCQLMEATQANLEPIFLVYDGGQASAATRLATSVSSTPPLVAVATQDGIRHRMWAVTSPADHAAVAADLATRTALIADGHHRYAAYLRLQARRRGAGDGAGPWDTGLALLVDSAAFPPRIGAIHRMVSGLTVREAASRASSVFRVRALPDTVAADPAAVLAALPGTLAGERVAFLVTDGREAYVLAQPDPAAVAAAMPGRSEQWRWLAPAVMQEVLFARLWGIRDDSAQVEIHHDAGEALHAAVTPPGGTAVLCPPMSAAEVYDVAARGERVPRKSTSFAPKPRTGLVLRTFALG